MGQVPNSSSSSEIEYKNPYSAVQRPTIIVNKVFHLCRPLPNVVSAQYGGLPDTNRRPPERGVGDIMDLKGPLHISNLITYGTPIACLAI